MTILDFDYSSKSEGWIATELAVIRSLMRTADGKYYNELSRRERLLEHEEVKRGLRNYARLGF